MPRSSRGIVGPSLPALAPLLFIGGATAQYAGAAWAVKLFKHVAPESVAWLRVCAAAIILMAVTRPWKRRWDRKLLLTTAAFGTATALMNMTFYLAARRLALGTTVAIEFVGPIAVAGIASRTARSWLALALAGGGVLLVSGVQWRANAGGVLFALLAAVFWAGYIVIGQRVSGRTAGIDGLALGLAMGAVITSPIGAWRSAPAWHSPTWLLLCAGIGIMSTIVPYSLDQIVMRRIALHSFALMLALLPTTAAVVGALMLDQRLQAAEIVGIVAVVAALIMNAGRPTPEVAML